MNQITDSIYIGDIEAASNDRLLESEGITHVLKATTNESKMWPEVMLALTNTEIQVLRTEGYRHSKRKLAHLLRPLSQVS